MLSKIVYSENPNEHWSDIQSVNSEIILDLGCCWLFQQHESTPQYFINRGANKVIGVDVSCIEIEKLKELYPSHEFICKPITSTEDLIFLLSTYKPTVIKMDIEGHESHLKNITIEQFSSVKEIAVEYHNPECKKILIDKLSEFGFEIFAINQFGWYCTDIEQMGILHAKK